MNKFHSQASCRIMGVGLLITACAATLMAQVEAPQTKGVYGGDIVHIAALSNGAAQTRVYVTTEGANSAFYGDIDLTQLDPFGTNLMFHEIPDMSASANHSAPSDMAFHQPSGRIFFTDAQDGILNCTTASNSITTNLSISAWALAIEGANLVAVQWDYGTINLLFGTLSADGLTFTQRTGSPKQIATGLAGMWSVYVAIHPTNHQVFINWQDTNIVRSSASIENLSDATTFTPLTLPTLTTNWTGPLNFGFGPDGRIFVGGNNPANTNTFHNRGWELTYSDNNGAGWSSAIDGGSGSPLWTTVGDAVNYWVYNGSAVSTNKGVNWQAFGTQVPGSRVGRGRVVTDPSRPLVLYCDTEGGFGACTNGGMTDALDTIINISRGIEAATINDFDITVDNTIAWIAANGIRRATNFQDTPEWSHPKWPMGDGTCNYVAVDKTDTNGLTVYAGGTVLYKTTNGGPVESNPFNATNWTCVFNPTNYGFVVNAVSVSAIEADGNIVVLGLQGNMEGANKGALFLSTDGGSNFHQVVLHAGGVDVKELLLTREGGAAVVYAAVANNVLTTAYGVFRISIADVTITHELTDTVNMQDLAAASDGSMYVSGFDTHTNVVLYFKAAGTAAWTSVPLDGYPANLMATYGGKPVIAEGRDAFSNEVPYLLGREWIYGPNGSETICAIYYMTTEGTNVVWQTSDALRYPMGTRINVMYWDDLVVGTSIGLYGQLFQPNPYVEGDIDGDRLADPYWPIKNNVAGQWTFWLSSIGYLPSGPYAMTVLGGEPCRIADFDGDGLADPVMVANGGWTFWFSSGGYLPSGPYIMSVPGGDPVAGDFDGDRLADPAMVANSGWTLWLSSIGYLPSGPYIFSVLGTDVTPLAGDFDGDRLADPVMVVNGAWTLWLSSIGYLPSGPYIFSVPGTDVMPMTGDFDGDGLADPVMVVNNNWTLWLSSGGYLPWGPYAFVP